MEQLAPGVWRLGVLPGAAVNAYLVDGVLVDAGVMPLAPLLLRRLRPRRPVAHALTHAHPDHQGASHAICAALSLPLWCGAPDAPIVATGDLAALLPPGPFNRLLARLMGGPAHPVARLLREGDALGSFVVLETPGHTPGHLSLWRQADGVLIAGDVLANQHPLTMRVGLIEPLRRFTLDPVRNRASARRLAALRPRLACFGHGPPLRDPGALVRFVDSLG